MFDNNFKATSVLLLLLISINLAVDLIVLHLNCCTVSFYINIISNQIKLYYTTHSQDSYSSL